MLNNFNNYYLLCSLYESDLFIPYNWGMRSQGCSKNSLGLFIQSLAQNGGSGVKAIVSSSGKKSSASL